MNKDLKLIFCLKKLFYDHVKFSEKLLFNLIRIVQQKLIL